MLGPFKEITLNFDRHVNVFIGPNNCGKSTVLMALAEAVIYPFSVPERLFRDEGRPKLNISFWDNEIELEHELPWILKSKDVLLMKELGYTGFVPALRENTGFRPRSPMGIGTTEPRQIRTRVGNRIVHRGYSDIVYSDVVPFETEGLEKHERELFPKYQPVLDKKKSDLSKEDDKELERRKTWTSGPLIITDQAVVSKIVELDYRAYRKNDPRFRNIVNVAASIASEIMNSFPLTFECIEENNRGLYPQFVTPDGRLPLDKLSQGTQSIIQWVSHLILGMAEYYDFPVDINTRKAVFIIDEIDAHMHPEWQRRIIPAITKNLPNCQLFVSTHSPLILSGLSEGQVQLLNRGKNNEVIVTTNEFETVGWSVDEIMRWMMGMKGTFDSETERVVTELGKLRRKSRLTKTEREQLNTLREEISERLMRSQRVKK